MNSYLRNILFAIAAVFLLISMMDNDHSSQTAIFLDSTCSISEAEVFETEQGPLRITPILHATMVIEWNGLTIYMDPYGGAEKFQGFKSPDLVLITHPHGDHLNPKTLTGV